MQRHLDAHIYCNSLKFLHEREKSFKYTWEEEIKNLKPHTMLL